MHLQNFIGVAIPHTSQGHLGTNYKGVQARVRKDNEAAVPFSLPC